MILGIGVDTIEIERFALWHTYSRKKLARIFSLEEIDYCLQDKNKSAQRFAVRFAAREALYKALSHTYPNKKIPFLTLCTDTTITKINGLPQIIIDESIDTTHLTIHVSLSHSRKIATAFVLIEKK
jgi:holo-[acyl-carrier protein] synthase